MLHSLQLRLLRCRSGSCLASASLTLLLKTLLTSADVFVLEVPEHPECDCAAHKSNNEDS